MANKLYNETSIQDIANAIREKNGTAETYKVSEMGEAIRGIVGTGEKYEGDYVITPKVEAQTLETKEKLMTDNVTVKEIPFFNTSNTAGGTTVYIGNEVM